MQSVGDSLTASLGVFLALTNSTHKMLPIALRNVSLILFKNVQLKNELKSSVNAFNTLLLSLKMILTPLDQYLTSFVK